MTVTVACIERTRAELERTVEAARAAGTAWDGGRELRVRALTAPTFERRPGGGAWRAEWEVLVLDDDPTRWLLLWQLDDLLWRMLRGRHWRDVHGWDGGG